MTDPKASRVFDSRSFFCVCRHEIGIACSVASAPRIRGVPRMPYRGCRTQGDASLCPGLSHYTPLGLDRWSIAVICKRVTAPFYKKNEIKRMYRPFLGSMDAAVGGAGYNHLAPVVKALAAAAPY